jgi:hypothetical protein
LKALKKKGLIYLGNANIFNTQGPETASQFFRGYTYILVVILGIKS